MLHPADRQQVEPGRRKPIPNRVLRMPMLARPMGNRMLLDACPFQRQQHGQEAVCSAEQFDPQKRAASHYAKRAADVFDPVPEHSAAQPIRDARRPLLEGPILSLHPNAAHTVRVGHSRKQLWEIRRIVLSIGVEGGDPFAARRGKSRFEGRGLAGMGRERQHTQTRIAPARRAQRRRTAIVARIIDENQLASERKRSQRLDKLSVEQRQRSDLVAKGYNDRKLRCAALRGQLSPPG